MGFLIILVMDYGVMKVAGKSIEYNSKEFRLLFENLFPSMCIFAGRILQDQDKGKDIAQDSFIKLWRREDNDFKDANALKAYLYVIVRNECISLIRKEKKMQSTSLEEERILPEALFLEEVLKEETYHSLYIAIKELSPQASRLIQLILNGYRNQDIAEELGVTLNTVKTVRQRAYKALRDKLKK